MTSGKIVAAITFVVICLLATIGWYIFNVAGDELAAITRFTLQASSIGLVIGLGILLLYLLFRVTVNLIAQGLITFERIRQEREKTAEFRAKRRLAEKEADVQIVTAGDAVFVREMNRQATWLPLHLNPGHHINGIPEQPASLELATWQMWNQRETAPPLEPLARAFADPVTTWPTRINLIDLLPIDGSSLRDIILGITLEPGSDRVRTISAPLEKLVHIAVGGETDSGKSNFGRTLAYQTLTAAEDVRVVLVDVGRTTFKPFADDSRLLYPLVDDETNCLAVLNELMGEVQRRNQLFDQHPTVEKLSHYNRLSSEPQPNIVVFLDEVTDLFENKNIQVMTRRLIRMSRKFGIYMVALGQSWKHTDLDTSIRRQFRTTIHFAAKDAGSSRTLLNAPDAVNISEQGRAIAALPFGVASDLIELQTPYLDLATALMVVEGQQTGPVGSMPIVEPSTEEKQIMDLAAQGKSISAIAVEVLGHKGGPQNARIRATLAKFGCA